MEKTGPESIQPRSKHAPKAPKSCRQHRRPQLITRRSSVQIRPPQPKSLESQRVQGFSLARLQFAIGFARGASCEFLLLRYPHKKFSFLFSLARSLKPFAVKWATPQGLQKSVPYCPLALPLSEKSGKMMPANFPRFFAPFSWGVLSRLSMLR